MKEIKSMIAGSVWKINVHLGDKVLEGQEVVILESMKMEIPIESEFQGKVVKINTAEGSFVNDGDVLIELE